MNVTREPGTLLLAALAGSAMARGGNKATGSTDATFMRNATADGLAEIQLGQLALEKPSSAQVRQLAQRIVDDHPKANGQLMSLAERKQITLPTEPMPAQQREAARLRAMSDAAFDQAYARSMVDDHRRAIRMFGVASQSVGDREVKRFASTTLPALKTHLQLAGTIAGGSMRHADGTPMDSSGSMGMPASGSSTR